MYKPARKLSVPGKGYRFTGVKLSDLILTSPWIVLKENLEREAEGLVLPDLKNTIHGEVLALGKDCLDEGIQIGDHVVYEEWQGGRWNFEDAGNCLVTSIDSILLLVR